MPGSDHELGLVIRKKRRKKPRRVSIALRDEVVDVAGILIFSRRASRAIDFLEARGSIVESPAVHDHVPVIADSDSFSAHGNQAFQIVSVWDELFDSLGGEHDDFSASRASEVVRYSINQDPVTGDHGEVHDFVACEIDSSLIDAGVCKEHFGLWDALDRREVTRHKPNCVPRASEQEPLFVSQT